MRILWLCNICLPAVAEHLGMTASNKEGWLTGLSNKIWNDASSEIELGVCFPTLDTQIPSVIEVSVREGYTLRAYPFIEDVHAAEIYRPELEDRFREIVIDFQPDIVHCFGTEYPHTLALVKTFNRPERTLIGIQGLCAVYAEHFRANLPERVWKKTTFRDCLKHDNLRLQQQKYVQRGIYEKEAISLTGHVVGRTPWDRNYTQAWNPNVQYHFQNETLRANFYEGIWDAEKCHRYRIFVSQGDYPIKGLHYLLKAMPSILQHYPDAEVLVAGNSIVKTSLKGGISGIKGYFKLESYGRYIRELLLQKVMTHGQEIELKERVHFLGSLTAEEMKQTYLDAGIFLCPSSIENSPNSVGEAMILGMPVVCANVGGIEGIFHGVDIRKESTREDGIQHDGCGVADGLFYQVDDMDALADAVIYAMEDRERVQEMCTHAREHALQTHDPEKNYQRLLEIYRELMEQNLHT